MLSTAAGSHATHRGEGSCVSTTLPNSVCGSDLSHVHMCTTGHSAVVASIGKSAMAIVASASGIPSLAMTPH
eukprot:4125693-Lingulodinium_polyedra.AAC.1